jgi:hypothetical protein
MTARRTIAKQQEQISEKVEQRETAESIERDSGTTEKVLLA